MTGAWARAEAGAGVPAAAPSPGLAGALPGREDAVGERRAWWRTGLRVLRDGAIGLLMLAAVPFAVVGFDDVPVWNRSILVQQLADAERLRVLLSPRDPSVTPGQAGYVLHRMQAPRETQGGLQRREPRPWDAAFPVHVVARRAAHPWELQDESDALRGNARVPAFESRASSRLLDAAAGKFSDEQLRYLRAVAASPVWADFDLVSRAPRVDVLGGRYVLPFREDAFAPYLPSVRYADSKALAFAGVSRAAYHLAVGEPERAEAALKAVVGFGFMLIDNGTTAVDALVGRVITDIGRDGLHQLYTVTGDARGRGLAEPLPKSRRGTTVPQGAVVDGDAVRRQVLVDVRNERLPRTLRYESLQLLAFGTCGTVRGMVLGASEEERTAFAHARTGIASLPSEQAYLTLIEESMDRVPADAPGAGMSAPKRLALGAAAVVGTVLQNPRILACTRAAMMFQ